jgi:hypothetical protein
MSELLHESGLTREQLEEIGREPTEEELEEQAKAYIKRQIQAAEQIRAGQLAIAREEFFEPYAKLGFALLKGPQGWEIYRNQTSAGLRLLDRSLRRGVSRSRCFPLYLHSDQLHHACRDEAEQERNDKDGPRNDYGNPRHQEDPQRRCGSGGNGRYFGDALQPAHQIHIRAQAISPLFDLFGGSFHFEPCRFVGPN